MAHPKLLTGKVCGITGGLTGIGKVNSLLFIFICYKKYCYNTNNAIQAIALGYLKHGAKVAVNHLGGPNDEPLVQAFQKDADAILNELGTASASASIDESSKSYITVAGDISQPVTGSDFVAKIVEAFGRLDVFVSNAGVCQFAEFLEYVFFSFSFLPCYESRCTSKRSWLGG